MLHPLTHDLLEWYDEHKRSLPWRDNRTPYGTLVSEVMLQQTRVDTVIPFFTAFMEKFPTIESLAASEQDGVLAMWSGLGYYSRARNLHKAAQQIVERGSFPDTLKDIRELSGVGEYIAGAIASMAFDIDVAAIDGNLHRVLSRIYCDAGDRKRMWTVVEPLLPAGRCGDFNQALMDLGSSTCKKSPECTLCPIKAHCKAFNDGRTDEFPSVSKKKQKSEESFVALFIRSETDSNRFLMAQRSSTALYGGMVEPCLVATNSSEVSDVHSWVERYIPECKTVLPKVSWLDRGHFVHILTHKKMTIRVFECSIPENKDIEKVIQSSLIDAYESIRWYGEMDRLSVGISTLATKVFQQSKNEQISLF